MHLYPIRSTCTAHLILLDSIIRIILRQEYRLLSSSDYTSYAHYKNSAFRNLISKCKAVDIHKYVTCKVQYNSVTYTAYWFWQLSYKYKIVEYG
jgi:hypothetical protein